MENKLKAYLESILAVSTVPWWEWDINKNKVTFNDLKVTNLGYIPADFRNSGFEAFTALIHPDDYERAMEAMMDFLYRGAPIYQVDYRIRDTRGRYHWYLDRGTAIKSSEDGSPLILRGVVIDLGEHFPAGNYYQNIMAVMRESNKIFSELKKGLVVLCSNCFKVEISENNWVAVGEFFTDAAAADISHSICPDCIRLLYPEIADQVLAAG